MHLLWLIDNVDSAFETTQQDVEIVGLVHASLRGLGHLYGLSCNLGAFASSGKLTCILKPKNKIYSFDEITIYDNISS